MIKHFVCIVFLIILTCFFVIKSCADDLQRLPELTSNILFKGDQEYEYKAGSLSPKDKSMWLGVGTREKGNLGGPQKLWIWRINATGKKVHEINLLHALQENATNGQYLAIEGLVSLKDGGVAAVLISETGGSLFARFDESGNLMFLRPLSKLGTNVLFPKILTMSDDSLLMIGSLDGRAAVVGIGKDGKILWKNVMESKENVLFFSDAAVLPKGELFLIGKEGDSEQEHHVWVGLMDTGHKFRHKDSFDGEGGVIAPVWGDNYIVAHALSELEKQTVWLRCYSPSLAKLWSKKIAEQDIQVSFRTGLRVAGVPGGGSLVIMSKESKPWIVHTTEDGKVQWSHLLQNESLFSEILWNFDLLQRGAEFTIPTTMLDVYPKVMEQRQELRIVKFVVM